MGLDVRDFPYCIEVVDFDVSALGNSDDPPPVTGDFHTYEENVHMYGCVIQELGAFTSSDL